MEKYRLRVFENRVLGRIFELRECMELENYITRDFRWIACNNHRRKKKCLQSLGYKTLRKGS
jgi:hypothetical protein